MPTPIDYHGIAVTIGEILAADSRLNGIPVLVETRIPMADPQSGFIGILVQSRRPEEGQPLAANRVIRMEITYEIWCYAMTLDERSTAAYQTRDEMLGIVELILLQNSDLRSNGNLIAWLEGGEFDARATDRGFLAGASVRLTVRAQGSWV